MRNENDWYGEDTAGPAEETETFGRFEESFFDAFWRARNRAVAGLLLQGTVGETVVDGFLVVFFAALAVAALGFSVRSFYSMTLRMLVTVLGLAVMATSVLFLRFTWEKVNFQVET